jgi:hypothetical protein
MQRVKVLLKTNISSLPFDSKKYLLLEVFGLRGKSGCG